METIELKYGDTLIVDPCYIKNVYVNLGGQARFDALKLEKVLHDGDDGEFEVEYADKSFVLGVDSGRIWALKAEFGCYVTLDSNFSRFGIVKGGENG